MDNKRKQKILIIGIIMNCAGTEKSFLSFAGCLDYDKYDVDLILAKKEGLLFEMIPKQINVLEMNEYGEMFLMSNKNGAKMLIDCFIKRKFSAVFDIIPFFIQTLFKPSEKSFIGGRMWNKLMNKYIAPLDKEYDAAVAYWGDRTMFYMIDKVKARKKITWLHFDYNNPPRDNELFLNYFKQCDKIVTVSETIDRELKKTLPEIAGKCTVVENINNPEMIRDAALKGDTFADRYFKGKRLLSIMRISKQKGIEFIPQVMAKLLKDGYDIRWYILGDGDAEDKYALIEDAFRYEIADKLLLLGTTANPYSYLRDCDIFVLPSLYEGKPVTVEEAKIMYKPIVVTNYTAAEEQLCAGRYGIITETSADGVYNGIKRMLDDEKSRDGFTLTLAKMNFGNTEEINKFYGMIE